MLFLKKIAWQQKICQVAKPSAVGTVVSANFTQIFLHSGPWGLLINCHDLPKPKRSLLYNIKVDPGYFTCKLS